LATLFIYTLTTAEQPDLFYSDSAGKLDLERLKIAMIERTAPSENGTITGEGFSKINVSVTNDSRIIECICTAQSSLGYYYEAKIEENDVVSTRIQHHYYSKSNIMITENSQVIIKFDWTSEEGAKTKVKSLIEALGFESISFRINHEVLRLLQSRFTWTAAKVDKIERAGDSTKRVSYEIDPSDDRFQSEVDQTYREHGKMSHLNFELPFRVSNKLSSTANIITVKLYSEGGNRIVIDETQFGNNDDFKTFQIYLLSELTKLRQEIDQGRDGS
jgi:hypothetical protein